MMELRITILVITGLHFVHSVHVDLTNINCETHDPLLAEFPYCYIKSTNRTYKYISLRLILHQPITNSLVTYAVLKRANGYKPFLYNVTVDGCKFLKNRKSYQNKLISHIYQLFAVNSNINHSCPYSEDIFIEKLDVNKIAERIVLPVPDGRYCFSAHFVIDELPRITVRVYLTIS